VSKVTVPLSVVLGLTLLGCNANNLTSGLSPSQDKTLQIWWSEGYYPEETEAIQSFVQAWQKETNNKVKLTFFSEKDLLEQARNSIKAGTPPDVIYGYSIDLVLLPQLAWQGKLADVSSIIEPIKQEYTPQALQSVLYFNAQDKKRAYYAVPISQQTTHIHYWKDLLEQSGGNPKQIPQQWSPFWRYWETAQDSLRKQGMKELYALGLPMSVAATDTFTVFEQFLEAYNVQILNSNGNLQIDKPDVRDALIKALTAYTTPYLNKYVPPKAVDWTDPDNNINFLSNLTLMTANATLSIPGSQRGDDINYLERMRTIPWPNKPSNEPMRYVATTKQVAIFQQTPHLEQAKSLVSFLVKPENLASYVEGAQGRFFPVMPSISKRPFWQNPKDIHVTAAAQQFKNTRPSYVVLNAAYSEVLAQNVWGEAVRSIVVDKIPPEKAADLAIEKITTIFAQWK
jgi:multiple sugar transport system substrate-binding protein